MSPNKELLIILILVAASARLFSQIPNNYKTVHFNSIVVDAHNDVVQRMKTGENISIKTNSGHSDLPRFREGGIDAEIFAVWVPPGNTESYFIQANEQIDAIESFVNKNSSQVTIGKSSAEIENAVKAGKFVVILGLEGGHPVMNDLNKLEDFYRRGVRCVSLTWNNSTDWATSAKDESDNNPALKHKGLTGFGRKIIKKMNELGIIIDVSHSGEKTFWDVINSSKKPIIASHSSAWTLCPNRRNLKDNQLKAIAKKGGIICINFAPAFIDSTFTAKEKTMFMQNKTRIDSFRSAYKGRSFTEGQALTDFLKDEYSVIRPELKTLIDHFDYVAKLVGVDHVGIGSDFDGINVTPKDMDDVTFFPNITRELLKRGYSESAVEKILGQNFLRVFREIERK